MALEGNKLTVTGTASPLAVNTGHAVVDGLFYDNTASVNLTVTTPVVGTTGGHVILRADYSAQTVRLVAVRNTDGVSSTPSLTQTSETTYEIRLATFTITTGGVITLTDARTYLHMYQMVATANIDDSAITSAKIVDGTIATGDLANDSVDDTKAGNRVPQFYRRQGGNASNWATGGATNQTPTSVRQQAGVGLAANFSSGSLAITFPTAFSGTPIIQLTAAGSSATFAVARNITSSGFTIDQWLHDGTVSNINDVHWFAVGPE